MQDHIFRMYDIRGIVGEELFVDQVYDCARACALYMLSKDPTITTVAVGMDGRVHSPAIKDEWVRGLRDSGLDVIFIGVCPTPLVSFSEYWLQVQAACMITASHNPKEYNGIKLFLHKTPLFSDDLQALKLLFKERQSHQPKHAGSYKEVPLILEYISYIKRLFPHLIGITMPLVFDCGNGAVGAVLPQLCEAFGWPNVTQLYSDVDGTYPHHEADPSVEENMYDLKCMVQAKKAAVGIAFDGDGDRMGAVTESGTMVFGDQLLALFSQYVLARIPGSSVVCDAKCSSALKEVVEKAGGVLTFSPSGHAFLRKAMMQTNAVIAGELSCHFFFKDRYFGYDDGLYAALRLIELLLHSEQSFDALLAQLPQRKSSPEIRITCKQGTGPAIIQSVLDEVRVMPGVKISTIDGVRIETSRGWGLLRASNTQPVICFRCESDSQEGLQEVRGFFVDLLGSWYDRDTLESTLRW